jgi:hypothetical protein
VANNDDKRTHSVPLDTDEGEVVIEQENVGPGVERGGGEFPDPHTPPEAPAPGSAFGTSNVKDVTEALEGDGFSGQFTPEPEGVLRCLACGYRANADRFTLHQLCRVEGASDPADMAAVAALECPRCHSKGTIVLKYGADNDADSADVLVLLERSAR